MICRLCLIAINLDNRISIFTPCENDVESQVAKLIAKFFHLEVTQHDSISTTLCSDCWNQIDDFHKFCIFVEEKQNTLGIEFLDLKSDTLQHVKVVNAANEQYEESLCGMKDVFQVAIEEVQLKCEPEEVNILEETEECSHADNDAKLFNDDIPLHELKTKCSKTEKFPAEKNCIPCSTSPSQNKDHHNFKPKVQDKDCYDFENHINFKAKHEEQPTTSVNEKLKKEYFQKYTKLSSADKYSFISQNMQMKCDLCDKIFQKFSEVHSHFRAQHKCRAYIKCCDIRHLRLHDLFEHIIWHLDPEYFKCVTCGKLFNNSTGLEMHIEKCRFKAKHYLYNCQYCDKGFNSPTSLKIHIKDSHNEQIPFACQHCNKRFVFSDNLTIHIQAMHENILPHTCDICGMKFTFKHSFEQHVLKHQVIIESSAKCPKCGKSIKNKNCPCLNMASQKKVVLQCNYCTRVCDSHSALRAHILHMHQHAYERPIHKCRFCGKLFNNPKMLREHVTMHTGEKLYSCPHCCKEFRYSCHKHVHIKRQHRKEWLAAQVVRTNKPSNVKNS